MTTRLRPRDEGVLDGWLCTGDVVTVDPEGYVQIQGRTRDRFKEKRLA